MVDRFSNQLTNVRLHCCISMKPMRSSAIRSIRASLGKRGLLGSRRMTQPQRPRLPDATALAALPSDGGSAWNRLVFERSPYLLQHAANPVDWRPWGDEAFDAARRENKPVFLSIGVFAGATR